MGAGVAAWTAAGRQLRLAVDDAAGRPTTLSVWHAWRGASTDAGGSVLTFLHGFPTSSFDWARVEERLPDRPPRLYLDLPGFGASSKPRDVTWGFDLWLEAVRAVWRHHNVARTRIVAHDLSVSLVQEILARMADGTWDGPQIEGIMLLNGGLFPDVYRPLPIQRLLLGKVTGPVVARLVTRRTFQRAIGRITSPDHPVPAADLDGMWAHIEHNGGRRIYHRLSRYHLERRAQQQRWTRALAASPVPLRFVWGLRDPISGGAMVEAIRDRVPGADVDEWADVGHYPACEVAARVAGAVTAWAASGRGD